MPEDPSISNGKDTHVGSPPSPNSLVQRVAGLAGQRDLLISQQQALQLSLSKLQAYLNIASKVGDALEVLSKQLFEQLLSIIEDKLSIALQEILEQPIRLRAQAEWKRGAASVQFWIERNGQPEDIMKGQGGSVANILSVGLRMFALMTLDEKLHQRFLVLDEQDCWIRPDLVPRLVKIVHDAGKALGFQVLMISHHEISSFAKYADRIYEFEPDGEGVRAVIWTNTAISDDQLA
jgi:DNA repair exonuclease SbcCD ATPase subunit